MAKPLPDDLKECEDFAQWKLCHELDSPGIYTLRNVFTKVIKYFFSREENLSSYGEDLACKIDKFHIAPGAVIDPGNTNMVPGIIITTGDGVSLDTPWISAQVERTPDYATTRNVHLASVPMTMICYEYDADLCAKISDAVLYALVTAEPMFFETWNWLVQYRPKQQTSPQLSRKATDQESFENFYESRVVVEVQYEYGTVTRRESRRMQDYTLHGPHEAINTVDGNKKTR